MKQNKRPEPIRYQDEHGIPVVRIPTDAKGVNWALLEADDYDRLKSLGLSSTFFWNDNGQGAAYVKAHARGVVGKVVSVARLVMGAGAGQVVSYRTWNRLDLRPRNLSVVSGRAKRRDEDLIQRPADEALGWR